MHYLRFIVVGLLFAARLAAAEPSVVEIARTAPVIFSGTVLAIESLEGAIAVTVRVEDGIKGVESGNIQFREWAGRWKNGAPYKVGDRFMFFLRATSDAGLTSPLSALRIRSGRVELSRRSARLGKPTVELPYAQFARRMRQAL